MSRAVRGPGEQLRRLHEERETANEQLRRLREMPTTRRRKSERLAAYCPGGCQVVTVYATSGRLLLELRGNILITRQTLLTDVPEGTAPRPGTYMPHRGHWLTEKMADRRWTAVCRHGPYPVAGEVLLSMLPTTGRARVGITALASTAC